MFSPVSKVFFYSDHLLPALDASATLPRLDFSLALFLSSLAPSFPLRPTFEVAPFSGNFAFEAASLLFWHLPLTCPPLQCFTCCAGPSFGGPLQASANFACWRRHHSWLDWSRASPWRRLEIRWTTSLSHCACAMTARTFSFVRLGIEGTLSHFVYLSSLWWASDGVDLQSYSWQALPCLW